METGFPPNPRYLATLTGVAALILVGGWLLRPRAITETSSPLPSDNELAELGRRAERRAIDDTTRFFADVAHDASPAVLAMPGAVTSALAWSSRELLTPPLGSAGASTAVHEGAEHPVRAIMSGPSLPFALFAWPDDGPALPVGRADPTMPASGAWVLALWRTTRVPSWVPGHFEEIHPVRCGERPFDEIVTSVGLRDEMRGGGLFDLDGALLGPILPCGGRLAVLTTASVRTIAERERRPDSRVQHALGVLLAPVSETEARHFSRSAALLVREVYIDAPADRAGLRPGDLMVSLGDRPIAAFADLEPLTGPSDGAHALTVQRGGREIVVVFGGTVAADPVSAREAAGVAFAAPHATAPIDTVVPGSRAATAGLRPGDRLTRIDGTDIHSNEQANRLLQRPSSMWLEVVRDDRRVGLLLPRLQP